MGAPISKEEGIEILKRAKAEMDKAQTKDEALTVLSGAGKAVGYKPAFRALVADVDPDKAIKW